MKKEVFATIITYNPDGVLEKNIASLAKQADFLLVVDNGSQAETLEKIVKLQDEFGFSLIVNDENKGIAAALNQALQKAVEGGYEHFLTMDQDTVLGENAVDIMLKELNENSLSSIGATYNTPATNESPKPINFLITSGNITKTSIAAQAGGFDDWMFIDGVDIDFSLKIRALGCKIAQSQQATMVHSIGNAQTAKFLFFKFIIAVHSLQRYYYIARNNLYLRKKYKGRFPNYCFKLKIGNLLLKTKILFLYKNKFEILKAMRRGRKDARKHKAT
jgi:rhamnosyltransferase